MNNVVAFPTPETPAWKNRLLANWSNPANWETTGDDACRFYSEQLLVTFYRDEDCGYWGFRVFDGPGYAEDAEYLWCFRDYAEDAALKHLIKIIEGRDKRAKRKGRARRS